MITKLPRRAGWWLEHLLALGVLAAGIWVANYVYENNIFPQPFFYDSSDTWMDWFNPAYWAHDKGTYDSWGGVYPPISFIFLQLTTLPVCYQGGAGFEVRDCDWLAKVVLNLFMVINAVLIAIAYRKHDRNTALPRWYALALGFPMLTAYERGNLFLVAFACFVLAHGNILKSARMRWLFAGLTVNFKVYLIAPLAAYLLRRRWRWFEMAILSSGAVYLLSWGILGRGSLLEIYDNIVSYAGVTQANSILDVWSAVTYQSVYALVTGSDWPVTAVLGSYRAELIATIIPIITHGTQLLIALACVACWIRPEAVTNFRALNLVTSFVLITAESGHYSQALMIFLTFFERWEGFGRRYALVTCYVLCIPCDIFIDPLLSAYRPSLLGGPNTEYLLYITVGPFLRPGLVLTIPFVLSLVTLRSVWIDVRTQGWKDRKRVRFDLPLFLNGGRQPDPAPSA